jgi:hypothetical protein
MTGPQQQDQGDQTKKEPEKNPLNDLYKYGKTNPQDLIAYILMAIGLLLIFFIPFVGGLLVGIVGAFYFVDTLLRYALHTRQYVARLGTLRSLMAGGVFLGLLLTTPGIIIGAAIVVTVKYALENK